MPSSAADLARRDHRRTRAVIAAAVLIAAVVVGVVVLNVTSRGPSDSPDHTFLETAQVEFPAVKASVLVSLGHTVCTTFDRHPSDPAAAEYEIANAAISQPDIPPANMVQLIRAAVHTYCPRYEPALNQANATTTSVG
jgi:Protein of unknown function (DUF732)